MGSTHYCLAFFFCVCLNANFLNSQTNELDQSVVPRVDERVELLSIVFRLAGNPEYSMNTFPKYSTEIDQYFALYTSHPGIQMAGALSARKGVSFDAGMSMAIRLSQPPELKPLSPFQ